MSHEVQCPLIWGEILLEAFQISGFYVTEVGYCSIIWGKVAAWGCCVRLYVRLDQRSSPVFEALTLQEKVYSKKTERKHETKEEAKACWIVTAAKFWQGFFELRFNKWMRNKRTINWQHKMSWHECYRDFKNQAAILHSYRYQCRDIDVINRIFDAKAKLCWLTYIGFSTIFFCNTSPVLNEIEMWSEVR